MPLHETAGTIAAGLGRRHPLTTDTNSPVYANIYKVAQTSLIQHFTEDELRLLSRLSDSPEGRSMLRKFERHIGNVTAALLLEPRSTAVSKPASGATPSRASAVSEEDKQILAKQFGFDPEKYDVVYAEPPAPPPLPHFRIRANGKNYISIAKPVVKNGMISFTDFRSKRAVMLQSSSVVIEEFQKE